MHTTVKIYIIFYYTHYHDFLKSNTNILLNIHSTNQILYPNNQLVNQIISPNTCESDIIF
jgi:hypothetical protein